jgi:hypothetical protein
LVDDSENLEEFNLSQFLYCTINSSLWPSPIMNLP